MITINFQENSSLGLTETIYLSIKKQINQGLLKKNEKLPSKRALAQNLGVSVITVQNAYGQLISEGYIYSVEKKGFFVTDLPMVSGKKDSLKFSELGRNNFGMDNSGFEHTLSSLDEAFCLKIRPDSEYTNSDSVFDNFSLESIHNAGTSEQMNKSSYINPGTYEQMNKRTHKTDKISQAQMSKCTYKTVADSVSQEQKTDTDPVSQAQLNNRSHKTRADTIPHIEKNKCSCNSNTYTGTYAHTNKTSCIDTDTHVHMNNNSNESSSTGYSSAIQYAHMNNNSNENNSTGCSSTIHYSHMNNNSGESISRGHSSTFQAESSSDHFCSDTWFSDFKNNSISYEKFPFSLWSHTMRQVLNSGDEKLLQRSQAKGVLELRKELSRYLLDFRNMNVSPEQIVIGAGTENLYALIVQLLGREKIYAVENPGYHKAEGVFRLNGVKTIPVNLDSQGISPEELEKSGAQVLHFSPSHHFPSGIVMPVRRRQEILRWAFSSPDRYILEDDYDSEFRFNGKPLLTLQSADSQNRVIYINTFSKTLAPSFRISYMVLPPDMLDYFEKKLGFYSCPVSSFEQYTLARFIQQGNFEKHIIRMKNYYRNLRNSLITAIQNSKLKEITKIQEKESGLHFLLTVNSEKSGQEIRENLEKNGINLPLIGEYYYGQAPQNLEKTFVVNYSGLKKEKIPETVRRLQLSFM